jgi:hypothetical protein
MDTILKVSQDDLIESFVSHVRATYFPGLQITDWPDKRNRTAPDVDALAESSNQRVAIEHTSIDSLPDQRQDNARFLEVLGNLEEELKGRFPLHVCVAIDFGAVPTGVEWSVIRHKLADWLLTNSTTFSSEHTEYQIPGIPFVVEVWTRPGGPPGLFTARRAPANDNFSTRLVPQLNEKVDKLENYKRKGYFTILLVESSDIALMSRGKLARAIEAAYSSGTFTCPDSIWYADTAISGSLEFSEVTPCTKPSSRL